MTVVLVVVPNDLCFTEVKKYKNVPPLCVCRRLLYIYICLSRSIYIYLYFVVYIYIFTFTFLQSFLLGLIHVIHKNALVFEHQFILRSAICECSRSMSTRDRHLSIHVDAVGPVSCLHLTKFALHIPRWQPWALRSQHVLKLKVATM